MRISFLALVSSLALVACGGTGTATPDAGTANDAGTASDTGTASDASAPSDSAAPIDTGIVETTYMLAPGDCFTFATATSMDAMSMTCGDLQSLGGDLSTPSGPDSMGGICEVTGTFTSVSAVPTDYASCAWSSYLEVNLSDGLADHGLIVRDATHTHHYRLHVTESAPSHPTLVFAFEAID
jgi:hypothetical protein